MRATTFVTAILAAATTADAGCYITGRPIQISTLLYHAHRACHGYDGKQGAFQGFFAPNQRKKACVTIGLGHVDMEVGNLNPSKGFDINDGDCYKEMETIIQRCSAPFALSIGGRFDVAGWTFRYVFCLTRYSCQHKLND
jgi:hypothetical protein